MSKSLQLFLPAVCAVCAICWAAPGWAIEVGGSAQVAKERARQATPVLQISPDKFQVTIREGEFQEVKLTVSNAGGQVLRWSAQSRESWIEPKTRSGELSYQGKQEVTLILRAPAGAVAGQTTSGLLRIEAPGAQGSPAVVPIAVQIQTTEAVPTEAAPPTESTEPTQAEPQAKPEADQAGQPGAAPSTSPWTAPSDASDERGEMPWEPKERLGLGLRLGFGSPSDGSEEIFGTASSIGLFYRRFQVEGSWGLEAGFDLGLGASTSDDFEGVETSLMTASGLLLYSLNKKRTLYVLGGVELWLETIDDPAFGTSESNSGLGLRFGAGTTLTKYPIDLRLGFSLLVGSDNVKSVVGLAVGYMF